MDFRNNEKRTYNTPSHQHIAGSEKKRADFKSPKGTFPRNTLDAQREA